MSALEAPAAGAGSAGSGASPFFRFQSAMAALTASSARTEQWIFTGGSASSSARAVFFSSWA